MAGTQRMPGSRLAVDAASSTATIDGRVQRMSPMA